MVRRRRLSGDSELRKWIAERATAEHHEINRGLPVDLGGDEHRARLAALAAGEGVDIRFGWLPGAGEHANWPDDGGHPGRRLGAPGEWGWLKPDDTVIKRRAPKRCSAPPLTP